MGTVSHIITDELRPINENECPAGGNGLASRPQTFVNLSAAR